MRVRADRPSYSVGQTYDTWDGQGWTSSSANKTPVQGGSPYFVSPGEGEIPVGTPDLQTFFVASSTPNLMFHAETATQVWFPASGLYQTADGSMVSPIGLGKGAAYTVESAVDVPAPSVLRTARGATLPAAMLDREVQLPHPYPAVQALAENIVASSPTTYDKVEALIAWIGAHTKYSTDIPPLPPGADTVNDFLFGSRVGFREQVSTGPAGGAGRHELIVC